MADTPRKPAPLWPAAGNYAGIDAALCYGGLKRPMFLQCTVSDAHSFKWVHPGFPSEGMQLVMEALGVTEADYVLVGPPPSVGAYLAALARPAQPAGVGKAKRRAGKAEARAAKAQRQPAWVEEMVESKKEGTMCWQLSQAGTAVTYKAYMWAMPVSVGDLDAPGLAAFLLPTSTWRWSAPSVPRWRPTRISRSA
jgi:hypothetical protein